VSKEIELKLEIPPGGAEALLGLHWLGRDWKKQKQSSVYFDTPDHDVRKQGHTLRVRAVDGRFIQTVKSLEGGGAGLFQRGEWEHQIDGPLPDAERLRHTPLATIDHSQLRPVVKSDVKRLTCRTRKHGTEIELAIDCGSMRSGKRECPVSELELELIKGDPAEVIALARRVAEHVPVALGVMSKAERGFALADGRLGKVIKAEPVPILPGMSVAEGLAAIIGACLRHYRRNESLVVEKRLANALHQARVAMRRLRSAFSLFRTAVADAEFEHLRDELRWFTGTLGDARNLDVYLESKLGADERKAVQERREGAYDRVIAAMGSARVRSLLFNLVAWSEFGEWRKDGVAQRPLEPYISGRIDRLWHKVSHAHHLKDMEDHDRHRLRILIKKLRYALEFTEPLFAHVEEQQKAFAKAVEVLQEALGHLNDCVVARTLVTADTWPIEPSEPTVQERALLDEAEDALRQLRQLGPYWRDRG
jgi:inorganic triphosphatase YgiF